MAFVRFLRHGSRASGGDALRWAPAAVRTVRKTQMRHNTPYMPHPFDTFQRPGAAKYWLSKHPPTDASQDEYEKELIYIDELDKRISAAQKNYQPSQKWKDAYNEYGYQDDNPVTESYGNIAGIASDEIDAKYGRGNKIDPSHYINPRFYKQDRVVVPSPYVHPDMRKRMGPLRNMLSLPPDEASVFKLWNPYVMFGSVMTIMLSKEYFLIGHDFWHAMLFWTTWSFVITVIVDWTTWWYALRGQEWYDQHYFPLNEQCEKLFKVLDQLENRPHVAGYFAAFVPYIRDLAQQVVEKKKADMMSDANISAAEKLAMKLKEEAGQAAQVKNQFREKAFQNSLGVFGTPEMKKKYLADTIKLLETNAELKPGITEIKNPSKVFESTYAAQRTTVETEYFTAQRKAGTLPWAVASPEEISKKKASVSTVEMQKKYEERLAEFSKKYHPVAPRQVFA